MGGNLFTANFARPDLLTDGVRMSRQGNGIGPVFNETSCVGCHKQGGVGGAGGLDSNILLLGIVTRPRRLLFIGPAFAAGLFVGWRLFGFASERIFRRVCHALIAGAAILGMPALDSVLR